MNVDTQTEFADLIGHVIAQIHDMPWQDRFTDDTDEYVLERVVVAMLEQAIHECHDIGFDVRAVPSAIGGIRHDRHHP